MFCALPAADTIHHLNPFIHPAADSIHNRYPQFHPAADTIRSTVATTTATTSAWQTHHLTFEGYLAQPASIISAFVKTELKPSLGPDYSQAGSVYRLPRGSTSRRSRTRTRAWPPSYMPRVAPEWHRKTEARRGAPQSLRQSEEEQLGPVLYRERRHACRAMEEGQSEQRIRGTSPPFLSNAPL